MSGRGAADADLRWQDPSDVTQVDGRASAKMLDESPARARFLSVVGGNVKLSGWRWRMRSLRMARSLYSSSPVAYLCCRPRGSQARSGEDRCSAGLRLFGSGA